MIGFSFISHILIFFSYFKFFFIEIFHTGGVLGIIVFLSLDDQYDHAHVTEHVTAYVIEICDDAVLSPELIIIINLDATPCGLPRRHNNKHPSVPNSL